MTTTDDLRPDGRRQPLARHLRWPPAGDDEAVLSREWLVTNGLGGYATGTVAGAITRRYHGLLVAAQPAPLGRMMLLNLLAERVRLADGTVEWLSAYNEGGRLAQAEGSRLLTEFSLDRGLPVWRFELPGFVLERTLLMPYGQNTVHVTYRMHGAAAGARLTLRPFVAFRPHDAAITRTSEHAFTLVARDRRIEVHGNPALPTLRLALHAHGGAFTIDDEAVQDVAYLLEESRGYDHTGSLWSPGYFRTELTPDHSVTMIASCEDWAIISASNPDQALERERARRDALLVSAHRAARDGLAAELVLAADQFIVRPAARVGDEAVARAAGEQARTIIAGYHWFTDWGRDTMIGLEGLTLLTGRHTEARQILRTFASHARDGLIPNLFPEGEHDGLYHTADATLWFFHALERYERHTGDNDMVRELLPQLLDIVDAHVNGTRFGIGVDVDGLLRQGAEGYQLTWMDAKVEGWVVTPRRGKAVEINALWYNALRLTDEWCMHHGRGPDALRLRELAARTRRSFNDRFWNSATGYLFDVVDGEGGDDPACRPNQLIAMSLTHAVLDETRWADVLTVAHERLLTPYGLRSLAPGEPSYKARYFGDLRARDAAYHQGTVWTWLLGPFVDAWLRVYPDDPNGVRGALDALDAHLSDAGIGSISEIFDAEVPFTARGCIAQAWSVAECLRALVNLTTAEARAGGLSARTSI